MLPKVSLLYAFDEVRNLYISVAKGYKAGGFNTQMFSDILSEKLKWRMAGSQYDEADLMSYEPEYSWNYELGGHCFCSSGAENQNRNIQGKNEKRRQYASAS